ncbi:MAG: DUF4373 domain-containing protein [Christensenellales bacterium]|jgi:hypothetical protein
MARSIKPGISYFSLDVDIFSDRKIRRIVNACGAAAVSVILKIWCSIYDEKGYYIKVNDDLLFDVADELTLKEDYVRDVVKKCIGTGLFDAQMHTSRGILTSPRIQRNYIDATKKRVINNEIIEEYRLVPEAKRAAQDAESTVLDAESTQSKVKKIKEDQSTQKQDAGELIAAYGENVRMTPGEYAKLESAYGAEGARRMAEILDNYKGATGKAYKSDYRAILSWVVRRWREEHSGEGFEHPTKNYDYLAEDLFANER